MWGYAGKVEQGTGVTVTVHFSIRGLTLEPMSGAKARAQGWSMPFHWQNRDGEFWTNDNLRVIYNPGRHRHRD